MKTFKVCFLFFRLVLLLALLLGAYRIFWLSHQDDPRFYRFLSSELGRDLAVLFGRHGQLTGALIPEKTEEEMSPAELAVKRALEEDIIKGLPSHQIFFVDGQQSVGRIIAETQQDILFEAVYGNSGSMQTRIPRKRIDRMVRLAPAPPPISYQDVRFKMEFPDMFFYKRPPYSIISDEDFFQIEHMVAAMRELHRQFVDHFGSLITEQTKAQNAQVVFFSQEQPFRHYQKEFAPRLESASGFYNFWHDRLVVFNQLGSAQYKDLREKLNADEKQYRSQARSGREVASIQSWRQEADKNLQSYAVSQTLTTIRHEEAHHLFYSCGVHSTYRAENDWLIEGLATYCEMPRIGEKNVYRIEFLRKTKNEQRLIPLHELINSKSFGALCSGGEEDQLELAYCQSWALIHYLMQPRYQNMFFDYVRFLRDPVNIHRVCEENTAQLLTTHLGGSVDAITKEYLNYIDSL